jgi:hypothetical protein
VDAAAMEAQAAPAIMNIVLDVDANIALYLFKFE